MNRKGDGRLGSLMIQLGLPKFLEQTVEVLESMVDEDAKLRKLKHQMRISLRDYTGNDVDNEDGA